MDRLFGRLIAAQSRWVKPFGEFNHRWVHALFGPIPMIRDLLNGRWLGHPLHAVLTDAPIGILFLVIPFDLAGQAAAPATRAILAIGILTMLGAAAAGLADYSDTDGTARERATLHGTLMVGALLLYLVSFLLRLGSSPATTAAIAFSVLGFLVIAAGAYVGGDVVYVFGNMVSRHAFRGIGTKWIALVPAETDAAGNIPEGTLVKGKLGINALVLVRQGETVLALHDQCAHASGPLSDGTLEGDCVVCPFHASKFRLADGRVRRGPSVYDQPAYEVRRTESGGWEARRRP